MPLIKEPSYEEKNIWSILPHHMFLCIFLFVAPLGGSNTAEHFFKSCGAPFTLN